MQELIQYVAQECLQVCAKDHEVCVLFCSLKEPPLLTGLLEPNIELRKAERLWENQLVGPESIVNIGGKH